MYAFHFCPQTCGISWWRVHNRLVDMIVWHKLLNWMIAHWFHHQTSELCVIYLKLVKDSYFYISPPIMDFYFLKNKITKKISHHRGLFDDTSKHSCMKLLWKITSTFVYICNLSYENLKLCIFQLVHWILETKSVTCIFLINLFPVC